MSDDRRPDQTGPILFLVLLVMVALIVVAWGAGRSDSLASTAPTESGSVTPPPPVPDGPFGTASATASASPTAEPSTSEPTGGPVHANGRLPGGGGRIFGGNRFLVAYYGTADTGALGVLGETPPNQMQHLVRRAAEPFRRPGQPVQIVYELIVTITDRTPGPDGDYSHDISKRDVQRYIRAAHRHDALLLLDLQPGRSGFLEVAKRWAWALKDPWVGLALDPEWRWGPHLAPAQVIGHVTAAEVNRTTRWLAGLTRRHDLPEKLLVLHQFRVAMIESIDRVRVRRRLAMVQHVDGFGTRGEKMATFHAVARPSQFVMGMKIFYDEDTSRMGPVFVHGIRPRVRFVSFQ